MVAPVLLGIFLGENGYGKVLLNADMCRGYIGFFAGVLVAAIVKNTAKKKLYCYSVVSLIGYVIFYSLMFMLGFNANKFYFRSAVNKIKKVKAKSDGRDTRGEIVRKGGTSAILLVTFILLMTLPSLIMYFIQFIPAMGLL